MLLYLNGVADDAAAVIVAAAFLLYFQHNTWINEGDCNCNMVYPMKQTLSIDLIFDTRKKRLCGYDVTLVVGLW